MSKFDCTEAKPKYAGRIDYIKAIKCHIAYYQGEYDCSVVGGDHKDASFCAKKLWQLQSLLAKELA